MSWHFSQALEAAYSQASGASSVQSSSTQPPPACYSTDRTLATSRRSPFGMTCEPLTDDHGEALLTWYLEDSLARTSALQEPEPDLTANAPGCGESSPASFARWDRATCSWKIPQLSLLGGSESFSETWPRWGMMRGGECLERMTPALGTGGTGSGLWPTPVATDGSHGGRVTPSKGREGGNLVEAVSARMYPTPTTQDAANNGGPSQSERNTPPLNAVVGGTLNPDWVEWLMGWPVGWTDTAREEVGTHDWSTEPVDVPRVTTRKDRRVPRLTAIGNGQVPQCAALAWRILSGDE